MRLFFDPQKLRRLRDDERGAALTEFTIFLPVFVICFVMILQLWAIVDLAVKGRANSYAKAMAHHTEIQTTLNPISWQMTPLTGGGNALNYHRNTSSGTDLAADVLLETPVLQGHFGEAYTRVLLAGPPTDTAETMMNGTPTVYDPPPPKLYSRVGPGGFAIGPALTADHPIVEQFGHKPDWPGGINFTNHLFSDHLDPGALTGSGSQPWYNGIVNNALSAGGLRPAVAAGLRYGVTSKGFHDETTTILRQTHTVQTATHVTAPTRPTDGWISTAIVRSFLTQDDFYDEHILKFAMLPAVGGDTADTAAFEECQDQFSGLSIDSITSILGGDFASGNPCQNGATSPVSNNPFSVFTNIFNNARSILGNGMPERTSTGRYGDHDRPLGF